MAFDFPEFRRSFSVNHYKDLRLSLGEMSFSKDWVNTQRGDPYPVISRSGVIKERTGDGTYRVNTEKEYGGIRRFAFAFFPYATYTMRILSLGGSAGFNFRCRGGENSEFSPENAPSFFIGLKGDGKRISLLYGKSPAEGATEVSIDAPEQYMSGGCVELTVTARAGAFDIYLRTAHGIRAVKTVDIPEFFALLNRKNLSVSDAEILIDLPPEGFFATDRVESYMDCGVSQADMRPIRYEDGSPIITDGRIYYTMSSRCEAGGYQSVISWLPSTSDFRLEGAIFYDCGDGLWCSDVAASVIYDRGAGLWRLWYCSFSHGHILAHGETEADLMHGINIVRTELMPVEAVVDTAASSGDAALGMNSERFGKAVISDDRLFFAKYGDEDPDFVFDKTRGKWLMTVCRPVDDNGKNRYRYFLFESEKPFEGYVHLDHTLVGENTGGSIVRTESGYIFVCGSDFGARSRYYKFEIDDFSSPAELKFDHDDGGFRGWGSVVRLPGSAVSRYALMTFDRHGGSAYNWSYGNVYVFTCDI